MTTLKQFIEGKKKFTLYEKDSLGNIRYMTILDGGEIGKCYNDKDASISILNFGYMLNISGGKNEKIEFIKDAAISSWDISSGDPKKFAQEMSKQLKIDLNIKK